MRIPQTNLSNGTVVIWPDCQASFSSRERKVRDGVCFGRVEEIIIVQERILFQSIGDAEPLNIWGLL
jgi:hypothetical protein